jgi:hypothetical protein
MTRLLSHGYTMGCPINGPNEGPPLYQVPAEALDVLSMPAPSNSGTDRARNPSNIQDIIDPVLLTSSQESEGK